MWGLLSKDLLFIDLIEVIAKSGTDSRIRKAFRSLQA